MKGEVEKWADVPDFGWCMMDARYGNVHPHSAGAQGGNQERDRTTRGSTTHRAVGLLVWVLVTAGFGYGPYPLPII
ncbi:hypothetical protein EBZ35_02110 [bacterium]|nr:hypothetical protein [bacterium]